MAGMKIAAAAGSPLGSGIRLGPVMGPMLMLLGISPEGATAAYRVGDGATNIITQNIIKSRFWSRNYKWSR